MIFYDCLSFSSEVKPEPSISVSVYEINRMIHGRLEIWNLSPRVQLDLLFVVTPLVADRIKHSKINYIFRWTHVLYIFFCKFEKLINSETGILAAIYTRKNITGYYRVVGSTTL